MSSLDLRSNSAVMKRAEQLKRWEESDTNREPPTPRPEKGRKIKFSSGCVFLAACLAGDKEEVLKLIENGADINTANVDGLTALHQACIDDNLEMVEFLIEYDAEINRQDNEGWTPLHATASCGFVSIARYLVEHGADVSAVNSDGDLAVDLAVDSHHLPMIEFMQKIVNKLNIDCEKARQAEEQLMLNDAKKWLRSDASEADRPHPKTGATALHVAAAKGYTKVLSLLLAGRANVDKQDNDGWTPLHAAAHWGQKEAAEMLVDAMADIDVRNYGGQTCIDVAERKMVKFLEELRTKRIKRRPSSQIRISDTIENHRENTPTKIIRVEVKPDQSKDLNDEKQTFQTNDPLSVEEEAPWRRNSLAARIRSQTETPTRIHAPDNSSYANTCVNTMTTTTTTAPSTSSCSNTSSISTPSNVHSNNSIESSDVLLRRTQSFEHDEKFYKKYQELRARIKANSCPVLAAIEQQVSIKNNINCENNNTKTNTNINNQNNFNSKTDTITIAITSNSNNNPSIIQNSTVQRSASLREYMYSRLQPISIASATSTTSVSSTSNITTPVRRSFAPPVRDEESETQRKLHAKRVRETRRSTQGVTLDEIKSAEELVKKKNSNLAFNNNCNNNNKNNTSFNLEDTISTKLYPPNSSAIIQSAPAVMVAANLSSTVGQRRVNSTGVTNSIGRPVSAAVVGSSSTKTETSCSTGSSDNFSRDHFPMENINNLYATHSITSPVTSSLTSSTTPESDGVPSNSAEASCESNDVNDNDKENDNRIPLATQAVIQRRRKPKRRSTGVVHVDMDDLDPERHEWNNDKDEKDKEAVVTSGNDRSSRSRLANTTSTSGMLTSLDTKSIDTSENGEAIDYKALWEAVKSENEKLKQQLQRKDDEVIQNRATLERITNTTSKNSLSEIEKRERRAMERKLSEMEEELKLLQKIKTENERLRAENRALTRVVSKLTTSAQNQLSKLK